MTPKGLRITDKPTHLPEVNPLLIKDTRTGEEEEGDVEEEEESTIPLASAIPKTTPSILSNTNQING